MKAFIEIDLPKSCAVCPLRFIHSDYEENEIIGCGYLNLDVTEFTNNRRYDCPLKTNESDNKDNYRIGNESDALRLLEDMIEKCDIKPRPDYEKGFLMIVDTVNAYFLPRLESLKDAVERGIV